MEKIHPWDLRDGGLPLKPFPIIGPELIEVPGRVTTHREANVPRGAVHNGFVPPERLILTHIIQPNPQSGNRQGKRA